MLPMQAPELAVKEMERCVKELGFPGVQIGSHVNEWDLNARELFPVYACSEHNRSFVITVNQLGNGDSPRGLPQHQVYDTKNYYICQGNPI
ncbi:hypothetical protein P7K49_014185 [Saguinus oedipus]|uniref:2-amino-3-carboxymuconate-6-semialdehyde decarboxylase n=1 Tax=Saguinus oedipus TaxID=9490 RepID=A0ABQ9VIV8_SAGOE|nr:hypothetical protein P7K49_014185 [Saguinus oedipus]